MTDPDVRIGRQLADGTMEWMDEVIVKRMGFTIGPNEKVIHLNGDWSDNRRENLRVVTKPGTN